MPGFRRETAALAIERRTAEEADELFGLYAREFGQELSESSRKRWRWQYLDNPSRSLQGPEIWVAREEQVVLGQYASMPVRLRWGGSEVRASWGMDVFLRPEARGRGLGAQLFSTWSQHVPVALGLGLTPSSYGLFKKLRYDDVGPVAFFQKILDPSAVARRRLGPLFGSLASPLLGLGLKLTHPERAWARTEVPKVGTIAAFDSEFDALWERAAPSYAMCVRRDAAYLNWKYVACPHVRYDLQEARAAGGLRGFAVSRVAEHRGLKLGWLVDLFADASDHAVKDALLGSVLDGFRRQGVARAQAFAMNRELQLDLRRRGFMPGRSPMQFCVRSQVDRGPIDDPSRWHVVFGDSDMDR